MIRIGFGCDDTRGTPGTICRFIEVPEHISLDQAEGWIDVEMQNREWVRSGDKHFCPEHNPALKGVPVQIHAGAYTEIAPGVNVRMPVGSYVQELVIEVQRDELSETVAVQREGKPPWLAKPPLIPGT